MTKLNRTKIFVGLSILFGFTLWFGLLSDFSWKSLLADLLYPTVTGVVGMITWSEVKRSPLTKKRLGKILCLPAVVGGSIITFLMILMIIPPFTLATLFWSTEQNDAVQIQSAVSPNQFQTAEVVFLPVGAYSALNGRIEIKVNNKWLPFVHRDFYYLSASHASEETDNYIEWIDDNHISISETGEILEVGVINFRPTRLFVIPVLIFRLLIDFLLG